MEGLGLATDGVTAACEQALCGVRCECTGEMTRVREDDTRVSSSGMANVSGNDTGGRPKEGRARLCDVGTSEGGL